MEVTAARIGYWAARGTRADLSAEQAATALGLDEHAARQLIAPRFAGWSPYG
ncbi:hypothetical protein [Streptomyces sp. NPDC057939]|uniref:hypothetical protein n=1 Tax=Streptomyces sp. NPDC057939 TaxID=3346284 RepID=UPI0036E2C975